MPVTLARKLVAEGLGTALLAAAVIGSGIMAQQLSKDAAITLLCNTLATGAALVAILLVFAPVSGALLNPAVTLALVLKRELPLREGVAFVLVQLIGGIAGAVVANAMFDLDVLSISATARSGFPKLFSEAVATFGLIGVVVAVGRTRPASVPFAVAAYITAAYWFTASTSFANPAITVARVCSDTYAGIRPLDVLGFVCAQSVGALVGVMTFSWLVPAQLDQGKIG